MGWLGRFKDEGGQVVVIVAICTSLLIGFLGLAIEVGYLRFEKRRLQAATDAAALAAGIEIRECGSTLGCPAMQAAANAAFADNGYSGVTASSGCTIPAGTALTLLLNQPSCISAADPNRGNALYVEAVASEYVQGSFSRMLGFNGFHVAARSEAGRVAGPCVYALDQTGANALNVGIALGLSSKCGVVVESSSPSAVVCGVGVGITAPYVYVTGGVSSLLCFSNPPPSTGIPAPMPADPLAYLPAPAAASAPCPTSTSNGPVYTGAGKQINIVAAIGQNITFNPGVYCGGIAVTAAVATNITFNPGVYVFKNGPGTLFGLPTGLTTSGLTMTLTTVLGSVTGNGVLFYNAGNAGGFSLTGAALGPVIAPLNLTAMTSGEYSGILFFQAHGVTNTGTILVNALSNSTMDGVIYEPDALVTYGVSLLAAPGTYNGVVAKDVQFSVQVMSTFYNDYSTLQTGSPFRGDYAALVQ